MLGDAADGAEAPSTLQASGGAPPPLAGAKKSLGDPVGPSKLNDTGEFDSQSKIQSGSAFLRFRFCAGCLPIGWVCSARGLYYREVVRVDRPLLWRIMIVGIVSYYWLIVW